MEPAFVSIINEKARSDQTYEAAKNCLDAIKQVVESKNASLTETVVFAGATMAFKEQMGKPKEQRNEDVLVGLVLIIRLSLEGVSVACQAKHADLCFVLFRATSDCDRADLGTGALEVAIVLLNSRYKYQKQLPTVNMLKALFPLLSDERVRVRHKSHLIALQIMRRADKFTQGPLRKCFIQSMIDAMGTTKVGNQHVNEMPVSHLVDLSMDVHLLVNERINICKALVNLAGKFGQHPLSAKILDVLTKILKMDPESNGPLALALIPTLSRTKGINASGAFDVSFGVTCAKVFNAVQVTAFTAGDEECKLLFMYNDLFKSTEPVVLSAASTNMREVFKSIPATVLSAKKPSLVVLALLNASYKAAFRYILPAIGGIFEAYTSIRDSKGTLEEVQQFASMHLSEVEAIMQSLIAIRDSSTNKELWIYGEQLDACLGKAIQAFGPRIIKYCPLKLREVSLDDPQYDRKSRSWILPLLKHNLKATELRTFSTEFLREASFLIDLANKSDRASVEKQYKVLVEQIWDLLSGFCTTPLDLKHALTTDGAKLAQQMCKVLTGDDVNIRSSVCHALLAILGPLKEQLTDEAPSILKKTFESNREVMVTLASKIMPQMFTAYLNLAKMQSADGESQHIPLLIEAIHAYAFVIADTPQLLNFFKTVVQRLLKMSQDPNQMKEAVAYAELVSTLLPALHEDEALDLVMRVFTPLLHEKEVTMQKAAYKVVRALYGHRKAIEVMSTSEVALKMWNVLEESRDTCEFGAIKQRMGALREYATLMGKAERLGAKGKRKVYKQFLPTFIPEILLRLREAGSHVRLISRECLHSVCEHAFDNGLQESVVSLMCAGMAGSKLMKSQTVDALGRLVYEYGHDMSEPLLEKVTSAVLVLLGDQERQIYRSVLKFCKVLTYVFPEHLVEKFLSTMIGGIFSSPHVKTSRMLIRKIVEKSIKRTSSEAVFDAFPEKHKPLASYTSKQLEKRKRRKARLQKEQSTWEEEQEESTCNAAGNGHSTDASMPSQDDNKKKRKKGYQELMKDNDEDDDEEDDFDAENDKENKKTISRKRKRRASDENEGEDDFDAEETDNGKDGEDPVKAFLDAWEKGDKKKNSSNHAKRRLSVNLEIREDGQMMDFLSADTSANLVATTASNGRSRVKARKENEEEDDAGVTINDEGKIVVEGDETTDEDKSDDENSKKKRNKKDNKAAQPSLIDPKTGKKSLSKLQALRKRRAELVQAGKRKKKTAAKGGHAVQGVDQFAPNNKSKGDAKKKNALDPYAYVKLNQKLFKEKHKHKAMSSFETIAKGGKKALKGRKAKVILTNTKKKTNSTVKKRR